MQNTLSSSSCQIFEFFLRKELFLYTPIYAARYHQHRYIKCHFYIHGSEHESIASHLVYDPHTRTLPYWCGLSQGSYSTRIYVLVHDLQFDIGIHVHVGILSFITKNKQNSGKTKDFFIVDFPHLFPIISPSDSVEKSSHYA